MISLRPMLGKTSVFNGALVSSIIEKAKASNGYPANMMTILAKTS